ncbi:MAG: xanthine dehydrogenase family protein molybdopterin-binding subunit, partial [Planctomycetes bacterium]|nr:xanthine dehydrogenase family protein molybdopterin-binding subunit [Planctomycetota bacterium]
MPAEVQAIPGGEAPPQPKRSDRPAYSVIGTRPIRHDGTDKVTGRARYGADVRFPGMLHGAYLRSPHAHARIKSIDTSKAEAFAGVHAVVSGADMPEIGSKIADLGEGMFNLKHLGANVLARDKVLYTGHAVAAVAAESLHIAQEAARLIEVEYEVLEPVLDVRAAMAEDAPILHDDLETQAFASAADEPGERRTNIAKHFLHEKGAIEQAFAEAALVMEREFTTATVHQGYIEPHTATALWNADGQITVWTSTQGSFTVREQVSGLLQQPLSKIKVVPMEIGGGFGGKIAVYQEPVAALLSKKSGRPVKLVMDRTEVLEATGPTPGSYMWVKLGVDGDGRIVAGEASIAFEAGAFPGSPVPAACMTVFACYDVPAGRVNGYDVCVNKPATKAYRAPGATHAAFAVETVIDEICEELGFDPLEFRLKNAAREGTRRVDGVVFSRIGMHESVEAILGSEHWQTPLESVPGRDEVHLSLGNGNGGAAAAPPVTKGGPGGVTASDPAAAAIPATGSSAQAHATPLGPPLARGGSLRRGRGVASGFWFNAGLRSSVSAAVNSDGTVSLVEGSTDIGGTRASIAMQLAETLGIAAEDVKPTVVDTDSVGYTDVTGGSRVTYATGWAAYEAGMDIRRQMIARAAKIWECDPAEVEYVVAAPDASENAAEDGGWRMEDGGKAVGRPASDPQRSTLNPQPRLGRVTGPNGQVLTFQELAAKMNKTGEPIVGRGSSDHNEPGGAFATHVVDVEVDTETGKVDILRYTASQDAGTAIHPSYVEGQMQGGVAQGVGWALNEEYVYDPRGVMQNSNFLDYRMPTCYDLPMIETIIVEVPNPGHPYGVRGVGE